MQRLLIANRGEIAVRIARTAAEMGIAAVGVYSEDDSRSRHVSAVDEAHPLGGAGPAAYLDAEQIVAVAQERRCDALHPGYGFLSESASFARRCRDAGIAFVGPSPEALDLFGDKARAREFASDAGVPVLPGTAAAGFDDALRFLASLGEGAAVMVKAVAGGGGRGMRVATNPDELESAFERCASEALAAFGDAGLYVERFLPRARHVEVQVVADGTGAVHLWDRECSLQRNRQKLVEVAPAVWVGEDVRERLFSWAERIVGTAGYRGLCTVEFLVDGDEAVFIEANPRLQVEHTVTEEVLGLDLVRLQLELADGASLAAVGLDPDDRPEPRGIAVQARVNLETLEADGTVRPGAGSIDVYDPPSGRGVRVDSGVYQGYRATARFDPLAAKVIVHSPPPASGRDAIAKARRALAEFRIEGVPTNVAFLVELLGHAAVEAGEFDTRFVEEHLGELARAAADHRPRWPGVSDDPLAVLEHGRAPSPETRPTDDQDDRAVRAPMHATVVSISAIEGDVVAEGAEVAVLEAMKMEHVVTAPRAGVVSAVMAAPGETVVEGQALLRLDETDADVSSDAASDEVDLDAIRPDLAEVIERHRLTRDEGRPAAVERRHGRGKRTVRENIDDLCDPGSFTEYGALTIAAQRRRRSVEDLIENTPADGLVMGLARVNGELFGPDAARCAVLGYDYTVLAGTQGAHNHLKLDRIAELALRWRLPTICFTEGGGGRPGDTEWGGFIRGFELWGRLSGAVPLVGITSGRCFAGNAALLGCCDVIIATEDSALGMGGPAMVEGGGLGVFRPEEIGPVDVMQANGVIDVLVEDEAAAVATAKRYLAYFQGPLNEWECADQRQLRHVIPENRLRAYDVRRVIELLADTGSVLELRPHFGKAMITSLVRVEGRPLGLIANNPQHLGGAIDSDAADKAARFLQICEAFGLPVLSLSDTPGNMVGPEAEKTGLIRHCSRLFVIGANLTVPILSVILRKSYGLGAIAMTGGSYQASMFAVAWPTGEFGGMGLEGAVKLGYRKELEAISDPAERKAAFERMVAAAYEHGKALSWAMRPELDDVIDPADTRRWVAAALASLPPREAQQEKRVPWIDAW